MRGVVHLILAAVQQRLQSSIIAVVILLASGLATMTLTLLVAAERPYDDAFARLRGAHLTVLYDARRVTPAQLRATAQLPLIAAANGPWPATPDHFPLAHRNDPFDLQVVGRSGVDGTVERLQLVAGRRLLGPGEIMVTHALAMHLQLHLGDTIAVNTGPHAPSFRLVGDVVDVDQGLPANWSPQRVWVWPSDVARLAALRGPLQHEMVYRVHGTPTAALLARGLAALTAHLPPGAVLASYTYLQVRDGYSSVVDDVLTFLLPFSLVALTTAGLIVAMVVTSATLTHYRSLGIMKALGCTPGQVAQVLAGQMLLPALVGALVGVPLGVLASAPLLTRTVAGLGLSAPPIVLPAQDLLVLIGVLLVVALTAAWPAVRAGRISSVDALTVGLPPGRGRPARLVGALQAVRLPQPLVLGVVDAWQRPVRSVLTALAILTGVASLTLALGLHASLDRLSHDAVAVGGSYQVGLFPLHRYTDQQIVGLLRRQRETATITAFRELPATISGLGGLVTAMAVRGDATGLGFQAVEGRWFHGPGEAVAGGAVMAGAHLRLGETVRVRVAGARVPLSLRIVGTFADIVDSGLAIRFDWSMLARVQPGIGPSTYLVQLRHGASATDYELRLYARYHGAIATWVNGGPTSSVANAIGTIDAMLVVLAALLALLGLVGAFNAAVLSGKERVRQTAVLRAMGMTPAQVVATVLACGGVIGLAGGLLGVPTGLLVHHVILGAMADLTGNATTTPGTFYAVFGPPMLTLPLLAAIGLALIGSALPAVWAARSPVAHVLARE